MTLYLIDKSALARATRPAVRDRLVEVLGADRAVTCPIVDLEMLYSARSPTEYELWRADRRIGYENLPLTPEVGERALAVQRALAARGQHRGVSLPDLLISACAAVHHATVLHYDADFDRIATETGQAAEWIVPRGSVS